MEKHFFKLVIIGDSGVGKSSLLMRFCDDSFREMYLTTIGVDFKFKSIVLNGTGVKLQIWDTAGQERFRTITSSYYKGAQGIIIVFDLNTQKSFEDISKYWLPEVGNFADQGVQLMLLGNKCDMIGEQRKINKDQIEKLVQQNNMLYFEVSAKTADQVEKAFRELSQQILCKSLESGNKTLIKENRQPPKSLQKNLPQEEEKEKNCCSN